MNENKATLVGIKLRHCRNNCKLSQQQVADTLGINRSTYSYYELGRSQPDLGTIVKLAQIFRVDASCLLPGEDEDFNLSDTEFESITPIYSLTRDEQSLLISYRLLDSEKKAEFLDKITNMANPEI
ncbi:MAG: helix-turn-helix transcriptional regulator [Ruminococcus sp.]|nr:helix-turn-helix transcriptional regulator [Ruminococcus sp.]